MAHAPASEELVDAVPQQIQPPSGARKIYRFNQFPPSSEAWALLTRDAGEVRARGWSRGRIGALRLLQHYTTYLNAAAHRIARFDSSRSRANAREGMLWLLALAGLVRLTLDRDALLLAIVFCVQPSSVLVAQAVARC